MLKLEELTNTPGWMYMRERFRGYRKAVGTSLARRLMAGTKISEEEIAFTRGYASAVKDIFDYPERVEKDLEMAAQKAFERREDPLSDETT